MLNTSARIRTHLARWVIRAAVAPILLSACDKDNNTAPTPVATNLALSSGGAQAAIVATALGQPVAVLVTDENSNPMPGVVVQFAPVANDGSVSASSVTTDANGLAQVQWILGNTAGADSLVATVGTLSLTVVATAQPDAPAQLTMVSGNGQSAPADSTLGAQLVVKVADRFGNAVPNVTVQWSDDSNGTLSSVSAVTDATGFAKVGYTLGTSPGAENVIATIVVGGTAMSTDFSEQAM
jgi:hypothetical protein